MEPVYFSLFIIPTLDCGCGDCSLCLLFVILALAYAYTALADILSIIVKLIIYSESNTNKKGFTFC